MRIHIIILSLFISSAGFSQGYWTEELIFNSIPGRTSCVTFTLGNRAFVIGGADSSYSALDDMYELDVTSGSWVKLKTKYPGVASHSQVSFIIDTVAYIGLGYNPNYGCTRQFYRFDVLNDTFIPIATFPGTARFEAVAFSNNGKGYVGLGMDEFGSSYNDFYEYNPKTNSWKRLADFPGGFRYSAVATTFNEFGFVGLGAEGVTVKNDLYSYNTLNGSWTKLGDFMTGGRYENIAFNFRGIPHIGFGFLDGVGIDQQLFRFDSASNKWVLMEINSEFKGFASSVLVFDDYFIVGFGKKNNTMLNTKFYRFTEWGLGSNRIINETDAMVVFPNPVDKTLFCKQGLQGIFEIYDLRGVLISTGEFKKELDVSLLSTGIYELRIQTVGFSWHRTKFVKI